MTVETAIEISNLNKFYGKNHVLHDLSFSVEKGAIFGFLGPNGSGKSTTIKILCGLVEPSSGSASILHHDVQTEIDQIRHKIGYMSQKFGLYEDLTVMQNLRFYGGLYGLSGDRLKTRIDCIVDLTKIAPHLHKKAGHLSGGWKQRLALGCAILHEPPVIFLDEPTAGIDPVARRDLWDLLFDLSSQGVTLFVTTHYMDEAERCHKVGYIFEGRLIAYGSSHELRNMDMITPAGMRRLEIRCNPLMKAYRELGTLSQIIDVTIFGAELHIMATDQISNDAIRQFLASLDVHVYEIERIEPSLEDVFVTLTQQAIAARETNV